MESKLREKKRSRVVLAFQIVIFVVFYLALLFFFRNQIRDVSNIVQFAEEIYGAYGYYLIFLGALVEGTFIIGLYIPGSLIVFLGVSLAKLGITTFPMVILVGTLGFCAGYSINYFLGRYGWYRIIEGIGFEKQIDKAKVNLRKHYDKALFWGYVMPSTGALLSTASGIMRVPFRHFLIKTVSIQLFWSLLLGGLAYIFGLTFIHMFLVYFGLIAFLTIGVYLFRKWRKK